MSDQAPEPTALEQVRAMQAAGEIHLCGDTDHLTEADAQAFVDFAEFLRARRRS